MSGGREDALQWGKSLAYKGRDLTEIATLDKQEQVVGAAHQISGTDFREATDSVRDGIKAAFALRGYFDFDDRRDFVQIELVLVQDGLVTTDNAAFFVIGDARVYLGGGQAQHPGDVLAALQRVGLQNF